MNNSDKTIYNWWNSYSINEKVLIMKNFGFEPPYNPKRLSFDDYSNIYLVLHQKPIEISFKSIDDKDYIELPIVMFDSYERSKFGLSLETYYDQYFYNIEVYDSEYDYFLFKRINKRLCVYNYDKLEENDYWCNLKNGMISRANKYDVNKINEIYHNTSKKVISYTSYDEDKYNETPQLPIEYIKHYIEKYNQNDEPNTILLEILTFEDTNPTMKEHFLMKIKNLKYIIKTENNILLPKI